MGWCYVVLACKQTRWPLPNTSPPVYILALLTGRRGPRRVDPGNYILPGAHPCAEPSTQVVLTRECKMKPLASNYSSVYYYGLAWSLNLDLTIGESLAMWVPGGCDLLFHGRRQSTSHAHLNASAATPQNTNSQARSPAANTHSPPFACMCSSNFMQPSLPRPGQRGPPSPLQATVPQVQR